MNFKSPHNVLSLLRRSNVVTSFTKNLSCLDICASSSTTGTCAARRHFSGLQYDSVKSRRRTTFTTSFISTGFNKSPFILTTQNMSTTKDLQRDNLFDVTGKIALVTGGGTGIGLMAAQALAVNGATVYIVGRRQDKLESAAKAHSPESGPGKIIAITGDVSSKKGLEQLVSDVQSKESKLNILVNNAGINHGPTKIGEPSDATELKNNLWKEDGSRDPERSSFEAWTDTYNTNVAAVYFTTVAFLPLLEAGTKADKGFSGGVVIISSMSGITKQSQGGMFNYNSSKGAVIHLNEMLATELANNKIAIRVNSIAPGFFPSEMSTGDSDETGKSSASKEKGESCPAGRPGNDKDMASAVLFCATNQYLNGVTIPVDGGWLLSH